MRAHHFGSLACKPLAGSPSGRRIASLSTTSATARSRPRCTAAVQQHAATFFAQAEDAAGADLPQFVKDEFDAFLECGILAHGFLRLRCGDCGHDKLPHFRAKIFALTAQHFMAIMVAREQALVRTGSRPL